MNLLSLAKLIYLIYLFNFTLKAHWGSPGTKTIF